MGTPSTMDVISGYAGSDDDDDKRPRKKPTLITKTVIPLKKKKPVKDKVFSHIKGTELFLQQNQ